MGPGCLVLPSSKTGRKLDHQQWAKLIMMRSSGMGMQGEAEVAMSSQQHVPTSAEDHQGQL